MYRCVIAVVATVAMAGLTAEVNAQTHRRFPADALRGELKVLMAPDVALNGQAARLAPGARIRGENNLMLLSASVTGQTLLVHYTLDPYGLVKDVWVLNEVERAKTPWPKSPQQAAQWQFNPDAQTWSSR